ncbi:MAG: 4Fe-4S dicluster domain-containing protein [Chromatiaceae bacterium]
MTRFAMAVDLNTCVGCNACMAACSMENQTPVVQRADIKYDYSGLRDCRAAVILSGGPKECPIGCIGLGSCAMACPYDARYPVTYADVREGKKFFGSDARREDPSVDKCDLCAHRTVVGQKPACVETCVGYARMFGDLDDPNDPVAQLVASGVARPLLPHLGTQPNVYYIDELKRNG